LARDRHVREVALAQLHHPVRDRGDGTAASHAQHDAAIRQHAAETDNEGRNAGIRDQVAVEHAKQQAGSEHDADGRRQRHIVRDVEHRRGAAQQAEQGANRQVDLAGDNHERHGAREDAGHGHLAHQVGQVARRDEAAAGAPAEEQPDQGDRDQQGHDLVLREFLFEDVEVHYLFLRRRGDTLVDRRSEQFFLR
jgi:hypothetical protein